ncbi:hypothetical protein PS639_05131 [Pseudomonas fluorescens]|nr:hypothetical protein PS639_05131 [Pseudomonas fluorescens]
MLTPGNTVFEILAMKLDPGASSHFTSNTLDDPFTIFRK